MYTYWTSFQVKLNSKIIFLVENNSLNFEEVRETQRKSGTDVNEFKVVLRFLSNKSALNRLAWYNRHDWYTINNTCIFVSKSPVSNYEQARNGCTNLSKLFFMNNENEFDLFTQLREKIVTTNIKQEETYEIEYYIGLVYSVIGKL